MQKPTPDLFHQSFLVDGEYEAMIDYTDATPVVHVFDPLGDWCGCTNALNRYTRQAMVRHIIQTRKQYNHERLHTDYRAIQGTNRLHP